MDACGVCGGGGASCVVLASVTVDLASTAGLHDPASPQHAAFAAAFAATVAGVLAVDAARVCVNLTHAGVC